MTDEDAAGARIVLVSGLVLAGLLALAVGGFAARWGVDRLLSVPIDTLAAVGGLAGLPPLAGAVLVVLGGFALVVVHESIHAASYVLFGDVSWDGVEMTVALFSPVYDPVRIYVYPTEPIAPGPYLLSIAMPGLLTGVVPAAAGVATGSPVLFVLGATGIVLAYIDVGVLVSAWLRPTPGGR